MSVKNKMFQPGAILHEVIVGALRSAGTSFEDWCERHGVHTSTARMATYGQMGGPRGQDLLERMIEEAGPELVKAAYAQRMIMEAKRLQGAAASAGRTSNSRWHRRRRPRRRCRGFRARRRRILR